VFKFADTTNVNIYAQLVCAWITHAGLGV